MTQLKYQTNVKFWTVPVNKEFIGSFAGLGPYSLFKEARRQDPPYDDVVNFTAHLGMRLLEAIGNGRALADFKQLILRAATAQAYTIPIRDSGWSPIYPQSTIIKLTAMSIILLEEQEFLEEDEKSLLVDWCNLMIPSQLTLEENVTADSLLASGTALIAWGNVTEDETLMNEGYELYMHGHGYVINCINNLVRQRGHHQVTLDELSFEDEYNIALQHAVEGAAILQNLGVDVFTKEINSKTLHDAVKWWSNVIFDRPSSFLGFKSWSHNHHLGWIPIYLKSCPSQPVCADLVDIHQIITKNKTPKYRAISLGGCTDSLW